MQYNANNYCIVLVEFGAPQEIYEMQFNLVN